MNTMVERVARAITQARFYDCEPEMYGNDIERFFTELDSDLMGVARIEARAAIEAMREPANAMLEYSGSMEGYDPEQGTIPDHDHIAWWQTMIDAALSERSE